MTKQMQRFALGDLRFPEARAAATRQADALLRADARRTRRMTANDNLGGAKPARPIKTKREDSPFAALRDHPLYRASRNGAPSRS